jgi:hypothetical protein
MKTILYNRRAIDEFQQRIPNGKFLCPVGNISSSNELWMAGTLAQQSGAP